ncbi:hypothetical protein FHL06_11295 [Lactobacillus halodurans]|uniref:Glycosyltransferase family 39 protein n=1 Tax=Companilactobacillus halodurans TaxID=2584183 RepID=A0A5P0ZUW4_9LACO|nr:hypothetical protein [Companilactobacillus halodurans]MQS96622.1 hypothetical protein [Companilactobacillus halodurans]
MGILIIVFAIVLVLNLKTLYTADDYVYRFVYHNAGVRPHMERITTWTIPFSMWNHYLNWNGRFVAHSIVQFFMQFNSKMVFDICNSLIYVLLIVFIDRFATKLSHQKHNAFVLPLIFFFTWFYIPFFGQSVLWVSGSGNYLWMSIIYLGYILYNLRNPKLSFLTAIFAAILGFLAGASNENSGPAAVLIVLLFMVKRLITDHKVSWNSIIGVIFSGIGFVTMMMSPGTQKRGAVHRTLQTILTNTKGIFKLTEQKMVPLYVLLVVLLIVAIILKRINWNTFWAVAFFTVGHFAAIYAMALSPEYPERTFFGGIMFLGIALFILVYAIFGGMRVLPLIASVAAAACFAVSFMPAYHDISISYYQVEQQYKGIEAARKKNPKNANVAILTPQKSKYNAYNGTVGIAEDPNSWMNLWESKFFGVNQISGYFQK